MEMKASIELEKPRQGQEFTAAASVALALPVILTLLSVIYVRTRDESAALDSIVIATGEYEPFTGKDLGTKGLATAIVDATFREMGYQPRYEYMPWSQVSNSVAVSESNDGIRAGFPYSCVGARTNVFLFSDVPLLAVDYSLFVRTGGLTVNSLDQLRQYPFILQDGYEYPSALREIISRSETVVTNSGRAAFKLLLESGKPFVLPEATDVGWSILKRDFPDQLDLVRTVAPTNVALASPLYLMASRHNPANARLISRFDRKLRQLKESGAYDSLLIGLEDQPKPKPIVVLKPLQTGSVIVAETDQGKFVVPSGARAEVENWSAGFRPHTATKNSADAGDLAVTVRLLDGPMAGTSVRIDGRQTSFEFIEGH